MSYEIELAPVVLFVYNRPDHTLQTLEALKNNTLASQTILYIFADGLKKNAQPIDKENRIKTRTVIRYDQWCKECSIAESDKNKGLALSIIEGVSQVLKKHGKVIVLEDDIVPSKYFLAYMNDALKRYEKLEKVWHISGYALPLNKKGIGETYFTKYMGCWGWGTWKNRWEQYRKNTDELLGLFSEEMKYGFNYGKGNEFLGQLERNKAGAINTWAIYWYGTIYLNNGLCLNPRASFTQNIGMDGSGVHCGETKAYEVKVTDTYPVSFEGSIEERLETRKKLERYFRVKNKAIIQVKKLIKRIRREGISKAIEYCIKKYTGGKKKSI
ncbi:hypothetical protein Holit_03161 [Hollandina sp. SP2]